VQNHGASQEKASAVVLDAKDIRKAYGHVVALNGAGLTVRAGEVVALIGDNGAGKSTLVKALSGVIQPDSGTIEVGGRVVSIPDPDAAAELGIGTVYQDLALAPDLGSPANFYIGRELVHGGPIGRLVGLLDRRQMRAKTRESLELLGVRLKDLDAPVSSLSGGQRQSLAIVRAVTWAEKVVFMDEPTAALGVVQTSRVLELIDRVRASGIGVVLVSHNMPQVLEIADRIEVLRLGTRVARFARGEATGEDLIAAMTGVGMRGAA
jgi:simple sugar transport system ATP-binding protein